MIKNKMQMRMMFANLSYLLSKDLLKYNFHRVEKVYFEEVVEFLRQEKIIFEHAEKKLITRDGIPKGINLLYFYFYPKFIQLLKKNNLIPGCMFEKISEFHNNLKLPEKDRKILTPVIKELTEICEDGR